MKYKSRLSVRLLLSLSLCLSLCLSPLAARPAPPLAITEIIRQAIKKVIVAVDLKIQRLQNETLWLQNAQKTVENALSKLRLQEIHQWTEKQKTQYQVYFNALKQVKQWIRSYRLVREIMEKQATMIQQQQQALAAVTDNGLAPAARVRQVQQVQQVLSGILEQSLSILQALQELLRPETLMLGDGERIARIQALNEAMDVQVRRQAEVLRQYRIWLLLGKQDQRDRDDLNRLYDID